ncbi:hypothetical protein SFC66_07665 [Terribacillus saccharophilus]|uniref:hypothetical protein n=1 Tax=Terribacillus saccharophilus TaxID=361277 RepID=UPI003981FDD7
MKTIHDQNGFLLLDALVSFALFLLVCALLLPLWTDIRQEQLFQERKAASYSMLQNELAQPVPTAQDRKEGEMIINLRFSIENGLKKGCLDMKGYGREEKRCLYAFFE